MVEPVDPSHPLAVGVLTSEGQVLKARAVVSGTAYLPSSPAAPSVAESDKAPTIVLGLAVCITDRPLSQLRSSGGNGADSNGSGASLLVIPPDTPFTNNSRSGHDHSVYLLQQGAGTSVVPISSLSSLPNGQQLQLVHVMTQVAVGPAESVESARTRAVCVASAVCDALFSPAPDGGDNAKSSSCIDEAGAVADAAHAASAAAAGGGGRPTCLWHIAYAYAGRADSSPPASSYVPPNWITVAPVPCLTLQPMEAAMADATGILRRLYGPSFVPFAGGTTGSGDDDDADDSGSIDKEAAAVPDWVDGAESSTVATAASTGAEADPTASTDGVVSTSGDASSSSPASVSSAAATNESQRAEAAAGEPPTSSLSHSGLSTAHAASSAAPSAPSSSSSTPELDTATALALLDGELDL